MTAIVVGPQIMTVQVGPSSAIGTPIVGPAGPPGPAGGNVLSIGLFVNGSTFTIATGTNTVRTSGYSADGIGIADYVYDAAVDAVYVAAHPRTSFLAANGRGFRLVTLNEPNIAQFGATNGADVTAACQAAINYLGTAGGTLKVPAWVLYLSAGLVSNAPVLFKADTFGDVSSNTNGSGVTSMRPIFYWTSASAGDMYVIKPTTAGNAVFGGGSDGITWDGAEVANRLVVFDNNIGGLFDGEPRRAVVCGVDVCSDSGTAGVFSQRVRIRRLNYVYGVGAAAQASHGLRIRGNGSTAPATQHQLGEISGLVYNGNLVDVSETDNMHAWKVHGVVQSGGTGHALQLRAGGAQGANNNKFEYVVGPISEDAGLQGNTWFQQSEGGGVSSGSVWHGELLDYVTGRRYASHRYRLQKKINIGSGDFMGDGAAGTGDLAGQWRTITLVDTTTSSASAMSVDDGELDNGTISAIEVFVASAGTTAGNYRLRIRVSTEAQDASARIVTPVVDDTSTYAAGAQYQLHKITLTFATPLAYTKGNALFVRVGRLGQDALDTNTDALHLVGARLLYKGTGPNSAGSGTYSIPNW